MKILFVCTGNTFRSMTAEYCLKDYLKKNNKKHVVSSAGIIARPAQPKQATINALKSLGINALNHKQKRLTKEELKEHDLIVAMAKNHQKYIKEKFNIKSYLFNKIAINKNSSILDDVDVFPNKNEQQFKQAEFRKNTVKLIHKRIPLFVKNMNKFKK